MARRPSRVYRARKLFRRRRGPFMAAAAVLLALVVDVAYVNWHRLQGPVGAETQGMPATQVRRLLMSDAGCYLEGIQRVRPSGVRRVFEREVHPDRMVILILGDPEAFDAPLETLGTVTIWDVEGIGNGEDARGLPGPSGISGYPRGGPRYPR